MHLEADSVQRSGDDPIGGVSVIPDVVVVGGDAPAERGVRLAARGLRVLVLEARARLGGRATAFAEPRSRVRWSTTASMCLARLLLRHIRVPAGDWRGESRARAVALSVPMIDRAGATLEARLSVAALTVAPRGRRARVDALDWKRPPGRLTSESAAEAGHATSQGRRSSTGRNPYRLFGTMCLASRLPPRL